MPKTPSESRKESKSAVIQRLLSRKSGATLATLQKATGWQAHSLRAALSTLRKAGYTIDRVPPKTDGGALAYRLSRSPADA